MIFVVELIKKPIEARNWKMILRYPRYPVVSMASLIVSSSQRHRHHAGLLRYEGDELVPSKSLEKELHEIQANSAVGTLSPIVVKVENYTDLKETIILEIHPFSTEP